MVDNKLLKHKFIIRKFITRKFNIRKFNVSNYYRFNFCADYFYGIAFYALILFISIIPTSVNAALAGYYQSAKEIKTILENEKVITLFSEKGSAPIQSIQQDEEGYVISAGPPGGVCNLGPSATCVDNCVLKVKVVRSTPSSPDGQPLIGGVNLEIVPGKLECTSSNK